MRGWVCRLQLLLALASAVILRSESRGTHDHILLSQIRDSPHLEGQVPVFISPQEEGGLVIPTSTDSSLLVASYNSQGYTGDTRLTPVKIEVTLRLAVYHQSFCIGVRPLEVHDQRFFSN
jgi:hypothetical protein